MIELKKYTLLGTNINKPKIKLNPTAAWGEIHGDINQQVDLKNLLATEISGVETWVNSQGFAKESDVPSLTGYATEIWVESKGYLTEHQSLDNYALKSDIPSLDGYVQETNLKTINGESIVGSGDIVIEATGGVTEEWVNSQGFATETWVESKGYALKSDIPSLTAYATMDWVEGKGYLTEHHSLDTYALKSEIPDITGMATETWVNSQGFAKESDIPSLSGYATETYVDNQIGALKDITTAILG